MEKHHCEAKSSSIQICNWHPLLFLTPHSMASLTNASSKGKWPFSATKLVMYQSPSPSSSGLEGLMHQTEFFSPFPISLKVPGPWAPFLTSLEGPRHPDCNDTITKQGSVAEHGALSIKLSTYETTVGLGPQLPLDSRTHDLPVVRNTFTITCFPQVLSDSYFFMFLFYIIIIILIPQAKFKI